MKKTKPLLSDTRHQMFQVRLFNAGPPDIYLILKMTMVDESLSFVLLQQMGSFGLFLFVWMQIPWGAGGVEGCGKEARRPAPSLQVWALPCLYPSNWNAKPERCEQTWVHQLSDLFDMIRTMMNVRFLNMSWCGRLGLESNSNQGNGSKIQSRPTSYSGCYSGLELTCLVLMELCTCFTLRFSHTHLSLVLGSLG